MITQKQLDHIRSLGEGFLHNGDLRLEREYPEEGLSSYRGDHWIRWHGEDDAVVMCAVPDDDEWRPQYAGFLFELIDNAQGLLDAAAEVLVLRESARRLAEVVAARRALDLDMSRFNLMWHHNALAALDEDPWAKEEIERIGKA